jgi:purine-nucleoside phosphorylase
MKRLYGEFTRDDWLAAKRLSADDIPDTLILHGEDCEASGNIDWWEKSLQGPCLRPRWNMTLGRYNGRKVGLINTYWAPMTAMVVHQYCAMGTQRIIQIGYCGGLSHNLKYGQILIVSGAEGDDGVSAKYEPGQTYYPATPSLVERAVEHCQTSSHDFAVGSVVSTSTMFLETPSLVEEWSSRGHLGVDGECAAAFAAARRFNAETLGLLTCSDHLIEGDTLYNYSEQRTQLEARAEQRILELALKLA